MEKERVEFNLEIGELEYKIAPGIRGMALITALMLLSFLTIVGAALLSSTTVDLKIANNYKTNTQLLFLAESGISAGRAALRDSSDDLSTDLGELAVDGAMSTSRVLATLLLTDDLPLLPSDAALRTAGQTLVGNGGETVGTYHVFLRNDPAEDATLTADSNDVVTLLSIARIGNATHTIEADVKRGSFPSVPAALTLDGGIGSFGPPDSMPFDLTGIDGATPPGSGTNENAIGVITDADVMTVSDIIIADGRPENYVGEGGTTPDVANIGGELDPLLTTVSGLEILASSIEASSTVVYNPAYGTSESLDGTGTLSDPTVVTVNGDATFTGNNSGVGILLVRGVLTIGGNFGWDGLILVIGQGELIWSGGGASEVRGGIFLANTRGTPVDPDALGPLQGSQGDVNLTISGGGGNGWHYNSDMIDVANSTFPYNPIAIREY